MGKDKKARGNPASRFVHFLYSRFIACTGQSGSYNLQRAREDDSRSEIELKTNWETCEAVQKYRQERVNELFLSALFEDELLILHDQDGIPTLNICLGFRNDDFMSGFNKRCYPIHTTWSPYIQSGVYKQVYTESKYYPEPIVDDLPVSMWLECMESTLAVLSHLNKMKKRRINITLRHRCSGSNQNRPAIVEQETHPQGDSSRAGVVHRPLIRNNEAQAMELFALFAVRIAELGERQRRFYRHAHIRMTDDTVVVRPDSAHINKRSRTTKCQFRVTHQEIPLTVYIPPPHQEILDFDAPD